MIGCGTRSPGTKNYYKRVIAPVGCTFLPMTWIYSIILYSNPTSSPHSAWVLRATPVSLRDDWTYSFLRVGHKVQIRNIPAMSTLVRLKCSFLGIPSSCRGVCVVHTVPDGVERVWATSRMLVRERVSNIYIRADVPTISVPGNCSWNLVTSKRRYSGWKPFLNHSQSFSICGHKKKKMGWAWLRPEQIQIFSDRRKTVYLEFFSKKIWGPAKYGYELWV